MIPTYLVATRLGVVTFTPPVHPPGKRQPIPIRDFTCPTCGALVMWETDGRPACIRGHRVEVVLDSTESPS